MKNSMLTYNAALKKVRAAVSRPMNEWVPLNQSLRRVLSGSLNSSIDVPGFDNTAVDGYALCPVKKGLIPQEYKIVGVSEAGRPYSKKIKRGEAVRVLTGAVVPGGADRVVMQEDIERVGNKITVLQGISSGKNIRFQGEDIRRGTEILKKHTIMGPADIALAAAVGMAKVPVYKMPSVSFFTTGDELVPPGKKLRPGEIYETNGVLLQELLREMGLGFSNLGSAQDKMADIVKKIKKGLKNDIILVSGGVSVGDKDFVQEAAKRCGIKKIFWRVNIKPGMPLFFGKSGKTLFFGLPGNPISVYVNFEEFVRPALLKMMGFQWKDPYQVSLRLARSLNLSQRRRTHFVRVRWARDRKKVVPLVDQGSHHLKSFQEADGWIRLDSRKNAWRAGDKVLVKLRRFS